MPRPLPPALALLAGLAVTGCASVPRTPAASLPEMATDRPDFTESASVVPRGHVQLEAGYTFTRDEDGEGVRKDHGYPEALLRVGVADRVELRAGQSFLTTRTAPGTSAPPQQRTGADDLYLGAKVRLAGQRGRRPELALIAQTTLPTGSNGFGAGRTLPGLNLVYAWDVVPDRVSVAASTQGNLAVDAADEGYLELTQSASLGYSLTNRVGAYAEWFASFPAGTRAGVSAAHSVDGGITVKLGSGLQWDVRVGAGLTAGAEGFVAGTGLAVRY